MQEFEETPRSRNQSEWEQTAEASQLMQIDAEISELQLSQNRREVLLPVESAPLTEGRMQLQDLHERARERILELCTEFIEVNGLKAVEAGEGELGAEEMGEGESVEEEMSEEELVEEEMSEVSEENFSEEDLIEEYLEE